MFFFFLTLAATNPVVPINQCLKAFQTFCLTKLHSQRFLNVFKSTVLSAPNENGNIEKVILQENMTINKLSVVEIITLIYYHHHKRKNTYVWQQPGYGRDKKKMCLE